MGNRIDISVSPSTSLDGLEFILCRLNLKFLHEARESHRERNSSTPRLAEKVA
jgi:hypothetical protein